MASKLYINTAADSPSTAAVRSELAPTPVRVTDVVKNDKVDYAIALVDGNVGDFDDTTRADVAIMKVGVGPIGGPALTSSTNWTYSADFFSGYLDFSVSAVGVAVGVEAFIDSILEVQITSTATSHAHTYLQAPVKILNRVNS